MGWAGDLLNKVKKLDDHDSIVARIGKVGQKYTDPLAWIPGGIGEAYQNGLVKIADGSNAAFSKIGTSVDKYASKLDPMRQIPIVDKAADEINKRPVDAAAIAAGAYFGGSALGGMMGGDGSGAGSGGASDWQQWARMAGNSRQGGQQNNQGQDLQAELLRQQQETERLRQERERRTQLARQLLAPKN
jgi:hypothetical protein